MNFGTVNEKLDEVRRHLEEASKSMTFGNLPSEAEFSKHWEAEMGDKEYPYHLKGSDAATAHKAKVPTQGTFSERELYGILKKLVAAFEDGDDEAGSLASDILGTLGFEWI